MQTESERNPFEKAEEIIISMNPLYNLLSQFPEAGYYHSNTANRIANGVWNIDAFYRAKHRLTYLVDKNPFDKELRKLVHDYLFDSEKKLIIKKSEKASANKEGFDSQKYQNLDDLLSGIKERKW